MTPTNAINPIAPTIINTVKAPITASTTATPANVMSKLDNTDALVSAFLTGRAVIMTNTKPINPNTTVKATIDKVIEATCFRFMLFE